jgi:hypothetical protein
MAMIMASMMAMATQSKFHWYLGQQVADYQNDLSQHQYGQQYFGAIWLDVDQDLCHERHQS